MSDYKELSEILKAIRGCDLILLDEVNFVEGWDRAIKHEVDGAIPTNLSKAYKDLAFGQKIVWTHSNFLKEYPQ